MADESSGDPANPKVSPQASSQAPQGSVPFTINNQYVRDLSVENPNAPMIYANMQGSPEIGINVNVEARRLQETAYETVLSLHVEAKSGERTAFVIELQYGALVSVTAEMDDERLQQILLVGVPHHLFPYARSIISGATIESGFPPLLISPIDFRQLLSRQRPDGEGGNGTDSASTAPASET